MIIPCHKRIYVLKGGEVIIPCHNSFPPYIKFSTVSPNMSAAFPFLISFIAVSTSFKVGAFRDRPFNLKGGLWFLVTFRNYFSDNTRVRIFCFCRAKREIFFQNLTLGYMTKSLNQIFFFSSTKIRIFFSATLGIRIFFLEKNHNPPLQVKWSFPYLIFTNNFTNYINFIIHCVTVVIIKL